MDSQRIKFRCPSCGAEGKARAEVLGHRVACKHCSHIFRAQPEDESPSGILPFPAASVAAPGSTTPAPGPATNRRQEAIEAELWALRNERSARDAEHAGQIRAAEARVLDLERRLAEPRPDREGFLLRELESLRGQVDAATAATRDAEEARDRAIRAAEARADGLADRVRSLQAELAGRDAWAASTPDPAEVDALRDELMRARADAHAAESLRAKLETASLEAGRAHADELAALRARAAEADRLEAEAEGLRARFEDFTSAQPPTILDFGTSPLQEMADVRDERDRLRDEALRRERAEAAEAIDRKDDALAKLAREREAVEADLRIEIARVERETAESAEAALRDREESWLRDRRSLVLEMEQMQKTWRDDHERILAESSRLASELAEALAEAGSQAERARHLETRLDEARLSAEHERRGLQGRIEQLSSPSATIEVDPAPPIQVPGDAQAGEAIRLAVDEAVKGAWVDFERRLTDTQARLKAANARAELLEAEARQSMKMLADLRREVEEGSIVSVDDLQASVTSFRIMAERGGARLTWADAEARLAIARQLAAERKDRPLIDRINKVAEKARADIDDGNLALADSLIRGMEIEVGLDPGGWSIAGQGIFRPSPSVLASLGALAPALDRAMRQGDPAAARKAIGEMRTVLGDQAGLPEIRRPGRVPKAKRPLAEAGAVRLFLDALEGENWLMRPILANRPPPDTSLTTYACLVEACAVARDAVSRHSPDRLELLDRVLRATAGMLARRQQPDGHFPFLDPRGKASRFASVVEAMVARQPDAVKDGWVVAIDPTGAAQVETGACGSALAEAGAATGRADWTDAALRSADWALTQPNLPNFLANACSLRLLARARRLRPEDRHLDGIVARLSLGLFPGQVEDGRWIDASSAQLANHLAILRSLQDAAEVVPPSGHEALRDELSDSIDRAFGSVIRECSALGVPANGSALRALVRHRDHAIQAGRTPDPRVDAAILDTATIIQELCHEGARPKLGVSPDLLAALILARTG